VVHYQGLIDKNIKRGWIMRKQKAKKRTTDVPVIAEEQPEAYKKLLKEKKDAYSELRDMTDGMWSSTMGLKG
jgi:hypothetical protein